MLTLRLIFLEDGKFTTFMVVYVNITALIPCICEIGSGGAFGQYATPVSGSGIELVNEDGLRQGCSFLRCFRLDKMLPRTRL